MSRHLVLLFVLVLPFSVFAQDRLPQNYERVLVPVGPAAGAFGAVWRTELWLRNDSDQAVDVFPVNERFCPVSSGCVRLIRSVPSLTPRETAFGLGGGNVALAVVSDMSDKGSFFYVQRGRLEDLTMQLFATDRSRTPEEVTALPLVPESQFLAAKRSIVGARIATNNRVSLRIFQLDPSMPDEVTVRIYETAPHVTSQNPLEPGGLLAERRFHFTPGRRDCGEFFFFGCDGDFVHHPGSLLIGNLLAEFPELASESDDRFGIRIEIEPPPGLRYWPMVTVTENQTNHVTVYTVR